MKMGTCAFVPRRFHKLVVILMLGLLAALCVHTRCAAGENMIVDRGAYWNGRVWFFKQNQSCGTCRGEVDLLSLAPNSKEKPRLEYKTIAPTGDFWMLGDGDRLWLIGAEYLAYYEKGTYRSIPLKEPFQESFRPFLFDGRPNVFEKRGDDIARHVIENDQWVEKDVFQLQDEYKVRVKSIRVIPAGDQLHTFWQYMGGDELYYHKGNPWVQNNDDEWQIISETGCCPAAVGIGNEPRIFSTIKGSCLARVTGMKLNGNALKKFFTGPRTIATSYDDYGVYPTGHGDEFVLLHEVFGGQVYARTVKHGRITSTLKFGKFHFLSLMRFLPVIVFFFVTIILVTCIPDRLRPLWLDGLGIPLLYHKAFYEMPVDSGGFGLEEIQKQISYQSKIRRGKDALLIWGNKKKQDRYAPISACNARMMLDHGAQGFVLRYKAVMPFTLSFSFFISIFPTFGLLSMITWPGLRPITGPALLIGLSLSLWLILGLMFRRMRIDSKKTLSQIIEDLNLESSNRDENPLQKGPTH